MKPLRNQQQTACIPKEAQVDEISCINTIGGKLELAGGRNRANQFKVSNSVYCIAANFPADLAADAQKALGRHVSVSGRCFYRHDESRPYKMDVRKMEVSSPGAQPPSFEDIRGIAPDMTGGKSSEDFVRELRDEWDEREKRIFGSR
ncbi:MAG: hypothetical protein OD918_05290 [Gammaproteobacteria bacterium]